MATELRNRAPTKGVGATSHSQDATVNLSGAGGASKPELHPSGKEQHGRAIQILRGVLFAVYFLGGCTAYAEHGILIMALLSANRSLPQYPPDTAHRPSPLLGESRCLRCLHDPDETILWYPHHDNDTLVEPYDNPHQRRRLGGRADSKDKGRPGRAHVSRAIDNDCQPPGRYLGTRLVYTSKKLTVARSTRTGSTCGGLATPTHPACTATSTSS
jgi:hypothetical protein